MTYKEAEDICRYRVDFCGNLYGAKWKEEHEFLYACGCALAEVQKPKLDEENTKLAHYIVKTYLDCGLSESDEQKEAVQNLLENIEIILGLKTDDDEEEEGEE